VKQEKRVLKEVTLLYRQVEEKRVLSKKAISKEGGNEIKYMKNDRESSRMTFGFRR